MRRRLREERGITLVELMIYTSLMVVVIAIVGAILGSALRGQRDVAASAQGNNGGQLISQSIATGIRSATEITVTAISPTTQLLVVRTPGSAAASAPSCRAWFVTTDGGGAVYTSSSPSAIAAPTAAQLDSWTLLATGIQLSTRTGAPATILTADATPARSVSFEFTMANGPAGKPILITSSASTRQTITGSTSCA